MEKKTRICLSCGERFTSKGVGNRICHICKHNNKTIGKYDKRVPSLSGRVFKKTFNKDV